MIFRETITLWTGASIKDDKRNYDGWRKAEGSVFRNRLRFSSWKEKAGNSWEKLISINKYLKPLSKGRTPQSCRTT